MENRSHALMAGIFTLVLLAAAALVAVWIGRDRTKLQTYEIISATAVSGLNPQLKVRYQGVPVGKVQRIQLQDVGKVLVMVTLPDRIVPRVDASAQVVAIGFVGDAALEFDPGDAPERLTRDRVII